MWFGFALIVVGGVGKFIFHGNEYYEISILLLIFERDHAGVTPTLTINFYIEGNLLQNFNLFEIFSRFQMLFRTSYFTQCTHLLLNLDIGIV